MGGFAYDNDSGKIKGATDDTLIGNVSDALKVSQVGAVTLSESVSPTFLAFAENIQIGNGKSMVSLLNASGSTKVVKLRELRIVNMRTTAITGVIVDFRMYRCTGHSSGTVITPTSYDTADTLDSHITARTGATISGEGSAMLMHAEWSSDDWSGGAPDTESSDHALQILFPIYAPRDFCKPITLRAGEGLTLKQIVNSTEGYFDVLATFTEE